MLRHFFSLVEKIVGMYVPFSEATQDGLDEIFPELEGYPICSISYTLTTDGVCAIDFQAVEDNFDPEAIASFVNFVTSSKGATSTLQTIKEGTESTVGEDAYAAFFRAFMNQHDEARKEDDERPLVDPRSVI